MLSLYQSSDPSIYALAIDSVVPPPLAIPGSSWEYRCDCTIEDLGPYFLEATRLVRDKGYCIIRLTCTQVTDLDQVPDQVAAYA